MKIYNDINCLCCLAYVILRSNISKELVKMILFIEDPYYRKIPTIWTPEKIAIIILKFEQCGFTIV